MFYLFKKQYQSIYLFVLTIFLAAILVGSFLVFEFQKFETEILSAQVSAFSKEPSQEITLLFVGDVMLDRGIEWSVNKYGQGDWKFPFLKIAKDLEKADILFGNLEGPISDKGRKVGSIYSFRTDPKAIEGLKYAGFDILSVANNHIFDYGQGAMEDTFLRLKQAGIDYLGGGFNEEEAYASVIKEINGTKIAFLAYTNLGSKNWAAKGDQPGITWLAKERLEKDIKEAKNQSDIVIVSLHFGEEYRSQSTSEQKFFARLSIDTGANLIVGHHPHVVQEIEQYKDGYIAYSLGNFVFDQGFSEKTMQGLILEVVIEGDKIKEATPIEIKINKFFQPEITGNSKTRAEHEFFGLTS